MELSVKMTLPNIEQAEYAAGFVTDIESEQLPAGLSEAIVRQI